MHQNRFGHSPVTESNSSALEQFALAVDCDEIDMAQTAFLIALGEYPDLDVGEEYRALDSLASGASRRIGREREPLALANSLSEYLFDEVGFRGNSEDYYDPRNCFLNEVLRRRLGIPITLSLVYMEIGKRLGIRFEGVGMPGHFLVRFNSGLEDLFIDPFHRGILLSGQECIRRLQDVAGTAVPWDQSYLDPVSNRELVARILRNLIAIYVRRNDQRRALKANEWLLTLQPQPPIG